MMKNKDDLITLAPMENYNAPDLPTLVEGTSDLLKKVPSRWKSKAMMAATVSLFGVVTLTGCGSETPTGSPTMISNDPIGPITNLSPNSGIYCSDLHHGGEGGGPIYVAYMTEQEALNIVHAQFQNAGISLSEALPRHAIDASDIYYELGNFDEVLSSGTMFPNYIEMQFIDEGNQTGVVLVKNWSWGLGSECTVNVRESIEQRFLVEHDITVQVLFERGGSLSWDTNWDLEEGDALWDDESQSYIISDEIREQLLEDAETRLAEQVQEIIDELHEKGIID